MPPVAHYHIHSLWYPVYNGLLFLPVEFQPNLPTLTFAPSLLFSPSFTIPLGTEWPVFSSKTFFTRISLADLGISCTFVLVYGSYTYIRYLSDKYQLPRRIYDSFVLL